MKPKEILSERTEYEAGTVSVKSAKLILADGTEVEWRYPVVHSGVVIIAVDTDKNVYLVKEWRLAYKRDVLQIPAGKCTSDLEEDRLAQVDNELREELGLLAGKIEKLGEGLASATINQIFHYYLAQELTQIDKEPEPGELLEVIKLPIREAYTHFKDAEVTTNYTYLGLIWAMEKLGFFDLPNENS